MSSVLRDVARARLTRVLATDPWVIVTAMAVVVAIPLAVVLIRQDRKARETTERSESDPARDKERSRAEDAKRRLDAAQVTFRAKAYVPIVGATPDRAPIELRVEGGNVWVQSVLLTWHYRIKDTHHTVVVDAPVLAWGENVLPALTQPDCGRANSTGPALGQQFKPRSSGAWMWDGALTATAPGASVT